MKISAMYKLFFVELFISRVTGTLSTYKLEAKWNRLCDIEALKEQ